METSPFLKNAREFIDICKRSRIIGQGQINKTTSPSSLFKQKFWNKPTKVTNKYPNHGHLLLIAFFLLNIAWISFCSKYVPFSIAFNLYLDLPKLLKIYHYSTQYSLGNSCKIRLQCSFRSQSNRQRKSNSPTA